MVDAVVDHAEGQSLPPGCAAPVDVFPAGLVHRLRVQAGCDGVPGLGHVFSDGTRNTLVNIIHVTGDGRRRSQSRPRRRSPRPLAARRRPPAHRLGLESHVDATRARSRARHDRHGGERGAGERTRDRSARSRSVGADQFLLAIDHESRRDQPGWPKGEGGYEVKRRLAPTVAAACREVRIRVLKEWRWFQGEYRKALTAWRRGERVVVFPNGTWWMRVHHAAPVPA